MNTVVDKLLNIVKLEATGEADVLVEGLEQYAETIALMEQVKENTETLYTDIQERQLLIERKLAQYKNLNAELANLLALQNKDITESTTLASDNEKLYRDSMHLLELSENLSVSDKLQLLDILKLSVDTRRGAKDLLTFLGVSLSDISNMFTGQAEHIRHTPTNKIPLMGKLGALRADLVKEQSGLRNHISQVTHRDIADVRKYRVKSRGALLQKQVVASFIRNTKKQDKKFQSIVLEEE